MLPLANPLHYPLAMFVAALVLGLGVRLGGMPRWLMLPVAVLVAVGGSLILQQREARQPALDDPHLAREIQQLRQQVRQLLQGAEKVRTEAARLLLDAPDLDWLITVQEVCDQVNRLPQALEQRLQQLRQCDDPVLSAETLEKQLAQVRRQKRRVSPVAATQLDRLEASLQRNIQLVQAGRDTRLAQVTALATLVQETAGVLQQLQNQLHTCDIHNQHQLRELQTLSDTLTGFEQQMSILITRV
ncbi:MAG: hypothetical protein Q6J74_06270 [Gloeomargarita sp. DG02_1_bins_92]